ncbi:trigger factor [Thiomicrorhabdus lithotrophica]|uniref:Trigger factor n=1 Tax=Thiomicrorhabdus lithotrophica TaxID=2949997 RepID=A0ABY8CCH2_9GAMM|nr:trigger factor [Thiomicrorhabdus lithotrophica]WEJ63696.1 trigger factor [Thiomicrorhabdus lithotrophica]
MQVTVEKPEQGLEHKMTVTFPSDTLNADVEKRLTEIRRTVKMDGFRPGKVPLNVVKKRHGAQVHQEVMGEALQKAFYDATEQEGLQVAGYPMFDDLDDKDGQVTFTARFEIYPEITLPEFSGVKVETIKAEVTDKDVTNMITRLREQRMAWKPSKSAAKKAKKGEQVIIDFTGKIDGEAFEGGSAENVPLELGSGRMIPGFEDGIIGMKKGEEASIEVAFPEDYHADSLKGKTATFDITVHSISTKVLPEVDEEFVKSFGIEDGTEESLVKEIKDSMEKELSRAVESKNRTAALEALQSIVDVEIPKSLLDQEVKNLMDRAVQNLQQQGVKAEDVNISADQFEEEARNRVKLGLVLGDIIKANKLEASNEEVEAYIAEQASSYEDPSEVIGWYAQNPGARSEIRGVLVEGKVAAKIIEEAKVKVVSKAFDEVINPAA